MVFNSVEFALFFPIVFFLYWWIGRKNLKIRNFFIILVSYVFYGLWDWRFLSLIFISSLIDYVVGSQLGQQEDKKKRKILLAVSLLVNIGFLAFFKYFNFFAESFIYAFTLFGQEFSYSRLHIILPVGISFYTFQTLSYTLDIYKGKLQPTQDPLSFFAFVSFFPQLVAGPIERATHLLPQFYTLKKPEYEQIKGGLVLMALGLFKKIVIADRLAIFVDAAYGDVEAASGSAIVVATIFFAFQLYLDFSAYSDIAIGTASTLGFNLSTNFKRPYLSKSFSDFWSRWHISLSSWFRDYLYIPLGGSRLGRSKTIRNVLVVFMVSGLWHGASWNFVIWGALNGLFLIFMDRVLQKIPGMVFLKSILVTSFWTLSLVFFRAQDLSQAIKTFSNLGFQNSDQLYNFALNQIEFSMACLLLLASMLLEIIKERRFDLLQSILSRPWPVRYAFYLSIVITILLFGSYGVGLNDRNFIYFQF